MPSFKVVYFNARGRAEPTRILLAHAGQKFEDVRYSSEEWGKVRDATPLQQLPILEVDGKSIPQSGAMAGYVARHLGLNGVDNDETTRLEVVLGIVEDLVTPLTKILFYEKDEEKKKEQMAVYLKDTAPKYLKGLEDTLKANGGGDGFFVGSKITRADITYFVATEAFNHDEILKNYPKLFALKERVSKDSRIAVYLAKRPKTQF